MRLLVAENDPSLGIFLQRGFGAERYSVDLTQNGEQAESLVRENEYDLAILDLSLPKEEGVAVIRHLRISRQGMPILVLTNRSQITERAGELDMGADDFVVKPFAFQQMGVFDASNTRPAVANSEPMPFSNVQMVENQERVQSMGRLVNAPRGALGESPDRADLNEIQRQLQTALAGQIEKHTV